ncbi:MAG: hypothetical protein RJB38_637 [Pseudomonadota bacterium]|jgi:hypothetical protein
MRDESRGFQFSEKAGSYFRVVILLTGLASAAIAGAVSEGSRAGSLSDAFRAAVSASLPSLGKLKPWQQQLFDAEVLPFAESFVREYRPKDSGYQVDVDEGMIRNYLSFFAPAALSKESPRFQVQVEAGPGCGFCSRALPALKRTLDMRLSSRGMKPFVSSSAPSGATSAKAEPDGLVSFRILKPARLTESDDAHAEDRKVVLKFQLSAGSIHEERQLEFAETDSVEESARKLLLEAFTGIGSRVLAAQALDSQKNQPQVSAEVLLKVSGVRDYFILSQLKSQVQLAVTGLQPVVERQLSKGSCILVLKTKFSPAELKAKLQGLALDQGKLTMGEVLVSDSEITLEGQIL